MQKLDKRWEGNDKCKNYKQKQNHSFNYRQCSCRTEATMAFHNFISISCEYHILQAPVLIIHPQNFNFQIISVFSVLIFKTSLHPYCGHDGFSILLLNHLKYSLHLWENCSASTANIGRVILRRRPTLCSVIPNALFAFWKAFLAIQYSFVFRVLGSIGFHKMYQLNLLTLLTVSSPIHCLYLANDGTFYRFQNRVSYVIRCSPPSSLTCQHFTQPCYRG